MKKLSHAYIISSPLPQTGLDRALSLAAGMLCSSPGEKPCGVCRDCRKVASGIHPDVSFIRRLTDDGGNPKNDISVAQIRQMRADASVLPNEAKGKVYIIEEAETMNVSAQNAALKVFEEPPAFVSFILVTTNPGKLLDTVRSRCALIYCAADDPEDDGGMSSLAGEYLDCVLSGDRARLASWCAENETLDSRKTAEFLACLKGRLTELLRFSDDKNRIMNIITLVDRCIGYQTVNTGVKHTFGLLAVRSLPAKETRKKVD